ncbi:Glutathione synthetase protein [Thalictrum thalictroides]|uniref:Glutathione synthetase protein n=1 Tax=Thalictrum thalictroides TaxID=46969 RepID=A0A7J6W8D0_THATH|nr:Glutathione synthetase protein [Thalictrum thalictroides]
MGVGYTCCPSSSSSALLTSKPKQLFNLAKPTTSISQSHFKNSTNPTNLYSIYCTSSSFLPLKCGGRIDIRETQDENTSNPMVGIHHINPDLLQQMVYDALVWCSLHGLVVGDKSVQQSGKVPGVGMIHAPFALLPTSFPQTQWQQACDLTCIFNELVDRVSLDGNFLQDTLSRTKKVDAFTSRLLDIHSKMLEINKKEDIRLGLHRSDYMLDDQTKDLLQIELNTISSSFPGLGCLVSELHSNLLNHYGDHVGLQSGRVPGNTALTGYVDALGQAWKEYNDPSGYGCGSN